MADEITLTAAMDVANAFAVGDISIADVRTQFDQAARGVEQVFWLVGTSAESLSLTDIGATDVGWVLLINTDDTNFVEVGADNTGFVAVGKLEKDGGFCLLKVADSTTIQLKADTAECEVIGLAAKR